MISACLVPPRNGCGAFVPVVKWILTLVYETRIAGSSPAGNAKPMSRRASAFFIWTTDQFDSDHRHHAAALGRGTAPTKLSERVRFSHAVPSNVLLSCRGAAEMPDWAHNPDQPSATLGAATKLTRGRSSIGRSSRPKPGSVRVRVPSSPPR